MSDEFSIAAVFYLMGIVSITLMTFFTVLAVIAHIAVHAIPYILSFISLLATLTIWDVIIIGWFISCILIGLGHVFDRIVAGGDAGDA